MQVAHVVSTGTKVTPRLVLRRSPIATPMPVQMLVLGSLKNQGSAEVTPTRNWPDVLMRSSEDASSAKTGRQPDREVSDARQAIR